MILDHQMNHRFCDMKGSGDSLVTLLRRLLNYFDDGDEI